MNPTQFLDFCKDLGRQEELLSFMHAERNYWAFGWQPETYQESKERFLKLGLQLPIKSWKGLQANV